MPTILNIDSAFDWTVEARSAWESLDWDNIRQAAAPHVTAEQWAARRDELALIGLVSELFIEEAYRIPIDGCDEHPDQGQERDDPLFRDWYDRQIGRRTCDTDSSQNRRPPQFSGEEPFFRSPRICQASIIECYGVYADNVSTILGPRGLFNKVPSEALHGPAIFLCPERIYEIYSTLLRLRYELRHPLPLISNPALLNFTMILLHELGHHFFPVHRSHAGRFLSEGLANFFCCHGLNQWEQAWLLYKSWYLQPPEYSAYRPLRVLCDADADIRSAVSSCFQGDLGGWASLPEKDPHFLDHRFGASLTMGLAIDSAALKGLWLDELCKIVSDENRWLFNFGTAYHIGRFLRRMEEGHVPADFVLDLYQQNDLGHWATTAVLPSRIWARWGWGSRWNEPGDGVDWPHDSITVEEADVGRWLAYYAMAKDTPLASVICEKLIPLLHANPHAVNQPALGAALDHALAVATDRQANWFDRVPAIRLIETCADVGAISGFKATSRLWMFAHYTVELESVAAEQDYGDVHDAASKAAASLRAAMKAGSAKDPEATG
jgi:hypothetical protein